MATFTWQSVPESGSVTAVSIQPDGTILGVDVGNGYLSTKGNASSWLAITQHGTAVALLSVSMTSDGTLVGAGTDNNIYTCDTLYGQWLLCSRSLPVLQVIELQDKSYLAVGKDNYLHAASGLTGSWTKVANSEVVIGVAQLLDGQFLAVATNNQLCTCVSLGSTWEPVTSSNSSLIAVAQLLDGTFLAVDTGNNLLASSGVSSPWQSVPYSSLVAVTQLFDGTLLGVTTSNTLATTPSLPCDWQIAEATQALISAVQLASGTYLGVNTNNVLLSCPALGGTWAPVASATPQFLSVTQIVDGTLLGVGTDNQVYTSTAVGEIWVRNAIDVPLMAAIQMPDGTLLGVGTDNTLYTAATLTASWANVPGSGPMLSVAQFAEGTLLGVGTDNTLYLGRFSHLLGKIDHVVVLMLENRGFDSLLGWLYGPSSLPSQMIPPSLGEPAFDGLAFQNLSTLTNTATINGKAISVTPFFPVRATDSPGTDPFEEFEHVTIQLYSPLTDPVSPTQATMKGFLTDFAGRFEDPYPSDLDQIEQIMAAYTPVDVPVLSTLARAYAVSDRWYSSVPTQTNANRAFSLAGTSLGEVNNGFYVQPGDGDKLLGIDSFETETIFNVLNRSGFTDWGVFWQTRYPRHSYTWNSFPMISEYISGASSYFRSITEFFTMAQNGTLPAFSYLEPSWGEVEDIVRNGNDYHPPADTNTGEWFLRQLFDSLIAQPSLWQSTLFILTFDEHGGTYDHSPPPWGATPPWGGGKPSYSLEQDFKFNRFGVRVPTLLISPLIAAGTVFRSPTGVPYDHTSMIATILDWQQVDKRTWNLGARTAAAPTFDNVVTLTTPRTDNPLAQTTAPAVGTPMSYGDPFYLANANGTVVIGAFAGGVYWYPQLGTTGQVAHTFRLGLGPLTSGCPVQLYTSAYLPDANETGTSKDVLGAVCTALGAWATPDCYYYPTTDYENYLQQYWAVTLVGGQTGAAIKYGDQVYLANSYYAGQGLSASGSGTYLTTKAGTGDVWTLLPAPRWTSTSMPPPPEPRELPPGFSRSGHPRAATKGGLEPRRRRGAGATRRP